MADFGTRWPCPTCLGATMEKATFAGRQPLTVDHCPRCGGVWFEHGEVQQLRGRSADELWAAIAKRPEPAPARCHACHALVSRDAERCPSCGERVVLDCPSCDRPLELARYRDLTLDVCRSCKGVWFDHHELAAIWTLELGNAVAAHRQGLAPGDASLVLLDSLIYAPDLLFYGAYGVGNALAAAGDSVASGGPELLGGAVEVVGHAAESVFEALLEIVGGIFS
jgi:Zn-finger nucleic acid-binding protein